MNSDSGLTCFRLACNGIITSERDGFETNTPASLSQLFNGLSEFSLLRVPYTAVLELNQRDMLWLCVCLILFWNQISLSSTKLTGFWSFVGKFIDQTINI